MNPRDLPEVVADLIHEMHEVRSELQAIHGRIDRLEATTKEEFRLVREEARQNTDRLIEAFGRSMEPLINRILDHDSRLGRLENPSA